MSKAEMGSDLMEPGSMQKTDEKLQTKGIATIQKKPSLMWRVE